MRNSPREKKREGDNKRFSPYVTRHTSPLPEDFDIANYDLLESKRSLGGRTYARKQGEEEVSALWLGEDLAKISPLVEKSCKERFGDKHQPIRKIDKTTPTKGRPLIVIVENPFSDKGEEMALYRDGDYGTVLSFSSLQFQKAEEEPVKPVAEMPANLIDAPEEGVKHQHIKVTSDQLWDSFLERRRNCNRRSPDQQRVMASTGKVSARDLVEALKGRGETYDWLHLVAWFVLGKRGQVSKNLVGGSKECNVDMRMLEKEIPYIASHYKEEGIDLDVKAELCLSESGKPTHMAEKITYTLQSHDFKVTMELNPRSHHLVGKRMGVYIHEIFKALITHAEREAKALLGQKESAPSMACQL